MNLRRRERISAVAVIAYPSDRRGLVLDLTIAPGYTEQNNPIEQRERMEHQAGGDRQKLDEDFLIALEHGMPPAGGIGIDIDRLCMMLLGQESIRAVILFPQLKPK